MSSPPEVDSTLWGEVAAGLAVLGGIVVALGQRAKKWATAKDDEPAWAGRFIDAMHEVGEIVQRANAATTENIRNVLAMYGKDVAAIRDAQQRTEDKLEQLAKDITSLRIDEAKRK